MQLFDAYTNLQQKLQQYERTGQLTPHPEAARPRFLAFAEADLMPLARRLATILCQAGIPAEASAQLEGDALWFGVFLDDRWSAGVYLQPFDDISMRLTIRFSWEPTIEEQHAMLYRTCTRVTFADALERGIERLLVQSQQSDVPCHLHLI